MACLRYHKLVFDLNKVTTLQVCCQIVEKEFMRPEMTVGPPLKEVKQVCFCSSYVGVCPEWYLGAP